MKPYSHLTWSQDVHSLHWLVPLNAIIAKAMAYLLFATCASRENDLLVGFLL